MAEYRTLFQRQSAECQSAKLAVPKGIGAQTLALDLVGIFALRTIRRV